MGACAIVKGSENEVVSNPWSSFIDPVKLYVPAGTLAVGNILNVVLFTQEADNGAVEVQVKLPVSILSL